MCVALGLFFVAALALLDRAARLAVLCAALPVLGQAEGALDLAMNARASRIEQAAGRPRMSLFRAAWSMGGALGAGDAGRAASQGWAPAETQAGAAGLAAPVMRLTRIGPAAGAVRCAQVARRGGEVRGAGEPATAGAGHHRLGRVVDRGRAGQLDQ